MAKYLKSLLTNQDGQSTTEYVLVGLALITFVLITNKTCLEILVDTLNQYLNNIIYLLSLPIP